MIEVIDVSEKFALFADHWRPKIVGELNESFVKLAKLQGEFVWHRHESEDELFLVVRGTLTIRLRDQDLVLDPGQFVIIPKGVDHLPVAEREVQVLLLEPKSTVNTGNAASQHTASADWI
jgi:mannose-6-phosphate isomerase-like protein (cupin superfamily)